MKHRQRLRKPHHRRFCIQTILPGLTLPHSPRRAGPQGLHHEKEHSAVEILSACKTELNLISKLFNLNSLKIVEKKYTFLCIYWDDISFQYTCNYTKMYQCIKRLEVSEKSVKMYISFLFASACYYLSKYFFSIFLTCH